MAWMVAISCSHMDNMRNWISLSEGVILRRVVLLKWVVRVMQVLPLFSSFTCWTQQQWIASLSAILAGPFCLLRQEHCWRKKKQNAHRIFFFTPSKWSARCLSLRYFLWLKAFSSYRSCPFFRGTAAVAHCVIVKTTHLRCWLQLWWAQACAQMLCRQGGGGKKVVMLSQCKITQQAFLPTVAPWGDVISKQSINPK